MKLWSGRFEKNTDKTADEFNSSFSFDMRLFPYDIKGSIAHARMLGKQGIITEAEAARIVKGLEGILADYKAGTLEGPADAEDVHMFVEEVLTSRIGETGKKLHTGRSRNDQVALDMRMYVKRMCRDMVSHLYGLGCLLLDISYEHTETIMPGYTHLQKAQPTTLAHHAMAYFEMFMRDSARFVNCYERADYMPLGSGALAGTTYPLNRQMVAEELGFRNITRNSLDAVGDRDFCLEFLFCASLTMTHLSRYCEELILWATDEFGFIEMDDAFSTGSSIMPQKKNPDVAELIRGKTGRVYGSLLTLLTVMKGLPLAYNKDMQEDKEAVFDAADTLRNCLNVFKAMLSSITFKTENMAKAARSGFANATDLADYLVKRGVPFRTAHEISGKAVLYCIQNKKDLLSLTLDELKTFSHLFEEDVYKEISLLECVHRRKVPGGPSPEAVFEAIRVGEDILRDFRLWGEALNNN